MRSCGWLMRKFSRERSVCAPQYLLASTWISPKASLSVRVCPMAVGLADKYLLSLDLVNIAEPDCGANRYRCAELYRGMRDVEEMLVDFDRASDSVMPLRRCLEKLTIDSDGTEVAVVRVRDIASERSLKLSMSPKGLLAPAKVEGRRGSEYRSLLLQALRDAQPRRCRA